MTVAEAKTIASEWAADKAKRLPDFAGAIIGGSTCTRKDSDPFPHTSDVDIYFAVKGSGHDVFSELDGEYACGAHEYKGLDIEVDFPSIDGYSDPEAVLAEQGDAIAFRAGYILADPTGVLSRTHAVVARCYAQEKWVRARYSRVEGLVRWAAGKARVLGTPLPGYADEGLERTNWFLCFGVAAAAGIPCVAALGRATTRSALANSRTLLQSWGMGDLQERLLGILGAKDVTAAQAIALLEELEWAFDLATSLVKTKFSPGFFFQRFMRRKIIDGVGEMIGQGLPREAMLFLAYIRTSAQNVFENDAPPMLKEATRQSHRRLMVTLGMSSESDLLERTSELERLLPDLVAAADTIAAGHPDVERG
jgi:hypothetical protein